MSDKWNEFFEKQALENMNATKPNGDEKPDEAEKAGENAEKNINESDEGKTEAKSENGTETKSEQKGTENHEGSEQETGSKETV